MTYEEFLKEWNAESPFVEVKTSGSTGVPKRMLVEKSRMLASAKMTCDFLGLQPGDTALLCMPLDYIAGKMMVVRSIERQLTLTTVPPSNHPLAGLTEPFDLVAMVPSQVYETLKTPEEAALLARCGNIIIGGGAISHELSEAIHGLSFSGKTMGAFYSSYGMTETLSHIALRRLNGSDASDWYTPMDGVGVSLTDEGCLVIDAPHVCQQTLVTNDIAELTDGRFRIIGRKDNVICSGGIKIQIEEVEERLRPHLHVPFIITKTPDEKFGEAVTLLCTDGDADTLRTICEQTLPRYWRPKHIAIVDHIPMTETGKPARKEAEQVAKERTNSRVNYKLKIEN